MTKNTDVADTANTVYPSNDLAVGCNHILFTLGGQLTPNTVCSQSLVRFDPSSLAGRTIISATLTLTTQYVGSGIYPNNWYVLAVASNWSPSTVTWNTVDNPSFEYYLDSDSIHAPPSTVGQTYDIDVTTTVQNWINGTFTNYGFQFTTNAHDTLSVISADMFGFYNTENSVLNSPKLTVVYQ